MSISVLVAPISSSEELFKQVVLSEFNFSISVVDRIYLNRFKPIFDKLKDNCYLLAETIYVDKVYRNSYYKYFSSKLDKQFRDCIRISIFEDEINGDDFRTSENIDRIKNLYRGFLIVRPTLPNLLGRNIISPKAFNDSNFECCSTTFQITSNSVKFEVEAFPHSSQDTETISCAETTLWALMEYFSNRYPEYKPILPSDIIDTLNSISTERQIPTKGLDIQKMSYALKEFGFGSKIYSRVQYQNEFQPLLSCYIESGIPLVLAMENRSRGGNIGHALLCIGHRKINTDQINALRVTRIENPALRDKISNKNIQLYDFDDLQKDFIFSDDNHPIYQSASINNPATHYTPEWHNCEITYFIAPLHTKIYLEAFEAKKFALQFLFSGLLPINDNTEILIRSFLMSNRSFKYNLVQNTNFDSTIKEIILEKPMSKFVWIIELSTRELLNNKEANGLLLLDATETNILYHKPLLVACYGGNYIEFDEKNSVLTNINLSLPNFRIFESNLINFNE